MDSERKRKLEEEINRKIKEEVDWRNLRILWHSVAPYIRSGYGTVTKYFMSGLANRGFVGFISAYYGMQTTGVLNWKGLYILPVKKTTSDRLGFKTAYEHYKRFKCDLGIFHADFWVSYPFAKLIKYSLCYSPLDHINYPNKWLEILRKYKWVAVPSRDAQRELKRAGIKSYFVPHGVNTKVFYPRDKTKSRKLFTVPENYFVIGIVAANNDDEPRKGWDSAFQAYKIFLDNNPDAKKDSIMVVHTEPENEKGRNLFELSKQIGIEKRIIWNDSYITGVIGLPEDNMARLYSCFDVFLALSRREGFDLPVLEAQACGVPPIANDFSALTERVKMPNGKLTGWLVKPATLVYSPLNAITSIPDPYKAADALEEAYNNQSKRKVFSKRSLRYAKKQTWDIALDKYFLPMLKEIGEEIPRTTSRKGLKKIAGD